MVNRFVCYLLVIFLFGCNTASKQDSMADDVPRRVEILFLGHSQEHHNSREYFPILAAALTNSGINITYTEDTADLNTDHLKRYDGLMIYANHEFISPSHEKALLNFVEQGNAFIPIHSASFCFQNSADYIDLVGAQFNDHQTGTFTARITDKTHPITDTLDEFSTWDETYVHHQFADDIQVLMERVEGDHNEPYTWIKQHGKGKIFYTAYGHDERTWSNPGFQNLIKEGILWAVNDRVKKNWEAFSKGIPILQYEERDNIPNYEKRDPAPKYQLPLEPEESEKLIQVPAGFRLELFASEPDIINPIAMNWDERGRLWVIETVDYPNTVRKSEEKGDDRIKILEDTDNDGKADKVTVFAENLNIPTSLAFHQGGIIVSQAPHFIFLKDTDGDDKADLKQVIMEGWGIFDTHAGPSNLQQGIDNMIYGVVGYSGFKGTIFEQNQEFRQGIYRFDPEAKKFEFLTRTSNNTWGLGITEDNSVFASTANNTHSVFMAIPNHYLNGVEGIPTQGSTKIDGHYAMQPLTTNIRQVDVFGGFTAAAGHHFYTARNYPDMYWNQVAFVCEPTGGLVHISGIEPDGAGYVEKDRGNLFASSDEWVSPVEARVGPDGMVWVLDWYNFIVQHNPTPTVDRGGYDAVNGEGNAYINPLRDKSRGRIWRIVPKNLKKEHSGPLQLDNPGAMVSALSSDNMFWRLTAQRLLVESGETDILEDLYQLIRDESTDGTGLNPGALHALWTLEGLDVLSGDEQAMEVVKGALSHPVGAVRKAAIQILSGSKSADEAMIQSNVLNDKEPQVQLAALLYFSEREPSDKIGEILYESSQESRVRQDRWLAQAIYLTATRHIEGFMAAFTEDHPDFKTHFDATKSLQNESFNQGQLAESLARTYYQQEGRGKVSNDLNGKSVVVEIGTIKNEMKYDLTEFVVEAGRPVELIFENDDFMQHNVVIGQPGATEKIGTAADKLATDPNGLDKAYVPQIPEVLYATSLVDPQQTAVLRFTAPLKPGLYPFICTFPGHWRIMQGVMKVVAVNPEI